MIEACQTEFVYVQQLYLMNRNRVDISVIVHDSVTFNPSRVMRSRTHGVCSTVHVTWVAMGTIAKQKQTFDFSSLASIWEINKTLLFACLVFISINWKALNLFKLKSL